jgi:radical SAM superfamily enzyme YgiQ (UPF0313 family)
MQGTVSVGNGIGNSGARTLEEGSGTKTVLPIDEMNLLQNWGANQKMDVLFIIPPVLRFLNRSSNSYPLGLGYLVSTLKRSGISAGIYNSDIYNKPLTFRISRFIPRLIQRQLRLSDGIFVDIAKKWPTYHTHVNNPHHEVWKEVEIVLNKTRPSIIGISSKIVDLPSTLFLAGLAKRLLPETPVMVGGPSAATYSQYIMKNDTVDFLVYGEGEETVTELCTYLLHGERNSSTLSRIKGIMYRDRGVIIRNDQRPLISIIDDIPFPDRESMFHIDRENNLEVIHANQDILGSRGCPYMCKFCCVSKVWGSRRTRLRSVDNILKEISFLKTTYNQRSFIFWDDLFTVNRNHVVEFCQKIRNTHPDVTWICEGRIDTLDRDLLDMMKQAGCVEIETGIESGSDRILQLIGKKLTFDQIRRTAEDIRASGIQWRIFLIIGFPSETKEEIRRTVRCVETLKPRYMDLSIFCPYPGTEFFEELNTQGRIDGDFMKSDVWYPYNNYTGTMTNQEFTDLALWALAYADRYNNYGYSISLATNSFL